MTFQQQGRACGLRLITQTWKRIAAQQRCRKTIQEILLFRIFLLWSFFFSFSHHKMLATELSFFHSVIVPEMIWLCSSWQQAVPALRQRGTWEGAEGGGKDTGQKQGMVCVKRVLPHPPQKAKMGCGGWGVGSRKRWFKGKKLLLCICKGTCCKISSRNFEDLLPLQSCLEQLESDNQAKEISAFYFITLQSLVSLSCESVIFKSRFRK